MPKIDLPPRVKCWRCDGRGYIPANHYTNCDCEGGYRFNLADLYRAVEVAGGTPGTVLLPVEDEPYYVAEILISGSRYEARGDSYEAAMFNVISKVNAEASDGR